MISASEWKAYNEAVAKISDGVESEVVKKLNAWRVENPAATVAETREYAKLVMNSTVQSYDGLAASFAAEWYDYQAERGGARLKQAVTASVYTPKSVDEAVRYQAKKLAEGDFEGFAKACGEYARNDSLRSLNETILANAKRDSREGVRFARVPTGTETCTFCLMLASRGAVYYSRKTAGDFKHFHRRCDCKVVPGFETDPDAELVEGYRPKELRKQWWAFEKVDATEGITNATRAKIKADYLSGKTLPDVVLATNPTKHMAELGRGSSGWLSSRQRLNEVLALNGFDRSSEYHKYLESAKTEAEFQDILNKATRILNDADATPSLWKVARSHIRQSRRNVTQSMPWREPAKLTSHAKKHASEFGIDYRSNEGQAAYDEIMSDTINNCDRVVVRETMAGQEPDRCAFYIRGDKIAVVNIDSNLRVSLFKYKEGYSAFYDSIWAEAHVRP